MRCDDPEEIIKLWLQAWADETAEKGATNADARCWSECSRN